MSKARVQVKKTAKKSVAKKAGQKTVQKPGVQFKAPAEYELSEPEGKRPYPANRKPRDYSENTSFELKIEDYLPSYRRAFKPELKKKILDATANLKLGQSVYLPASELGVATVRALIKDEIKKPFYKNKDIRIIASSEGELEGCRIARYL